MDGRSLVRSFLYTTKLKFLAVLERIFHRRDAEHAETENAETTDFTDGLQWTRAFAVPQGRRCAPFIWAGIPEASAADEV